MRDDELEGSAAPARRSTPTMSRARWWRGALLRERELVVARLRRLGVQIVEAPADRIGPALLAATST